MRLLAPGLDDLSAPLRRMCFAEHAGHLNRIVHLQANEPTKQQSVLGLLNQLGLRAHAEINLQQQGSQQLLGRNAEATAFDVCLLHAAQQDIELSVKVSAPRIMRPCSSLSVNVFQGLGVERGIRVFTDVLWIFWY